MIPRWLPDKNPVHVQVQSFQKALKSFFSKSHFSRNQTFLCPMSKPHSAPSMIRQSMCSLNSTMVHGGETQCHRNATAPTTCLSLSCMDSVSIDQRGKLSLTPLNMTLGIFSTRARKQPEAWETLCFHPDNSFMSSKQFRKTPSASLAAKHNIINLHSGLCVALASLKMAIDGNGLLCHNFPWAGKKWSVQMKFSIAFVIGDTELHDKLCT